MVKYFVLVLQVLQMKNNFNDSSDYENSLNFCERFRLFFKVFTEKLPINQTFELYEKEIYFLFTVHKHVIIMKFSKIPVL